LLENTWYRLFHQNLVLPFFGEVGSIRKFAAKSLEMTANDIEKNEN